MATQPMPRSQSTRSRVPSFAPGVAGRVWSDPRHYAAATGEFGGTHRRFSISVMWRRDGHGVGSTSAMESSLGLG